MMCGGMVVALVAMVPQCFNADLSRPVSSTTSLLCPSPGVAFAVASNSSASGAGLCLGLWWLDLFDLPLLLPTESSDIRGVRAAAAIVRGCSCHPRLSPPPHPGPPALSATVGAAACRGRTGELGNRTKDPGDGKGGRRIKGLAGASGVSKRGWANEWGANGVMGAEMARRRRHSMHTPCRAGDGGSIRRNAAGLGARYSPGGGERSVRKSSGSTAAEATTASARRHATVYRKRAASLRCVVDPSKLGQVGQSWLGVLA